MVTVIGFDKRLSDDDREFFALTIQGEVEVIQSQNGNLYMTARKTSIPSTFDEEECQLLLGKEIPGNIKRTLCDAYEYVNKDTGEVITLHHTYEYVEESKLEINPAVSQQFIPYNNEENVLATSEDEEQLISRVLS